MNKQLVLTQSELEKLTTVSAEKALQKREESINIEAFNSSGCKTVFCVFEYETNMRNEDVGIAFKNYCMQNDINSKMCFDIFKDLNYINVNEKGVMVVTVEGFTALNGTDVQSSPVITVSNGILHVDDRDDRFEKNVIKALEGHDDFDPLNGYNSRVKNRVLKYSRSELKIIKEIEEALGKKILIGESDESQND